MALKKILVLGIGTIFLCALGMPKTALGKEVCPRPMETKDEITKLDNGVMIHSREMGKGYGSIVFETGYGDDMESFTEIQKNMATLTKTISYDRTGLGTSSDVGNMNALNSEEKEILMNGGTIDYNEDEFIGQTKTAKDKAINLYKLLKAKEVPAPYILVGHSIGGHTAIEFAKMYKDEVGGIVFLDSSARSVTGEGYEFYKKYMPEIADLVLEQFTEKDGTIDEILMGENQVKNDKNALRDIPVLYIESDPYAMLEGEAAKAFGEMKEKQVEDLLSLSNYSNYVQVKNAGHYVHLDNLSETTKLIKDFFYKVQYAK